DPTGNVIRLVNLNEEKKPASDSTQEETAEKTEKSPETEQASNANDKEIKTVAASTEPAQEEDKDDLNAVGNYLVNFPKNRVKIDERWAQTYSVPVAVDRKLQQDVRLKREYRLRSVENGIASITFKTSVLSSIHNPMIAAQLIQNTPSGTIEFDLERGLIVKRTAELDNTEFGFSGENSSMRAVSKTVETLVNSEIKPETEPAE
ncbi:MAG: hypothetical protein KDA65_09460, partial [Planctomycetaceae bacterium]|nr:hypothetical protein [Planctomycetaceae bacterium]